MMHQEQSELQTMELQATGTSVQTGGPRCAAILPHQGPRKYVCSMAMALWLTQQRHLL